MVIKVRRGIVFTTMAVLLFIALAFVLCVMVITSSPSSSTPYANYYGEAKLVLQITGFEDGHYNTTVLKTNDKSIPINDSCWLFIEQTHGEYWTWDSLIAPSKLTNDTIIGINDYEFSNNITVPPDYNVSYQHDDIEVTIPYGADWTTKIEIIGVNRNLIGYDF